MADTRELSTPRRVLLLAIAAAVVFLLGFVPQWIQNRSMAAELQEVRAERSMLDLGGRLGAALAESQRGNYERARQLMTTFFSELQASADQLRDPHARQEMRVLLEQRDEIITLLSRAEPEATSRLNIMYTRFFSAVHPLGREAPPSTTPPPPT